MDIYSGEVSYTHINIIYIYIYQYVCIHTQHIGERKLVPETYYGYDDYIQRLPVAYKLQLSPNVRTNVHTYFKYTPTHVYIYVPQPYIHFRCQWSNGCVCVLCEGGGGEGVDAIWTFNCRDVITKTRACHILYAAE